MTYYNPTPLLQSPGDVQHPLGTGFVNRGVDPNSLVSNQLTTLLGSNSPYIQQARQQAASGAASRGLLNSSIASGAGQAAAISAGLPIATADASTYGTTAANNMDAENNFLLHQGDWANQHDISISNNATQRAIAEEQLRQNGSEWQQSFDRAGQQYDTDWQRQVEGAILGNQLGQTSGLNAAMYGTIFGDPSLYRDPSAASGFMSYWGGQFQNQLQGQLDPYLQQFGITMPGTPPPAGGGA